MRVEITRCDQCAKEIGVGARHFAGVRFELAIVNGHTRTGERAFPHLCGDECLHAALTVVARGVEEMK